METSWLAETALGAVALQSHCPMECRLKENIRGSFSFLVLVLYRLELAHPIYKWRSSIVQGEL